MVWLNWILANKTARTVLMVLAAVGALLMAYAGIKRKGAQEARTNDQINAARAAAKRRRDRAKIEADVDDTAPDAVLDELLDDWSTSRGD